MKSGEVEEKFGMVEGTAGVRGCMGRVYTSVAPMHLGDAAGVGGF